MNRKLRDYGSVDIDQSPDDDDTQGLLTPPTLCADLTPAGSTSKSLLIMGVGMLAMALIYSTGGIARGSNEEIETSALMLPLVPLLSSSHRRHHHRDDPLFYRHQLVDHNVKKSKQKYWPQRYYASGEYFGGPGHPIFLVIGGEDTLDKMLYPFVNDHLAKDFDAYVVYLEHRFYGVSQPLKGKDPSNEELARLLTPDQAMKDLLRLVQHIRHDELKCSHDKSSKHYCPIISVGGSYPGFLSAMMRFLYPDVIDIGYASSAPLLTYSQSVNQDAYYEVVTRSAERSSPGCAAAVKSTLMDVVEELDQTPFEEVAERLGLCMDTLPAYISTNEVFRNESIMLVEETFADYNMGNYPPTEETDMAKACKIFQDKSLSPLERVTAFYRHMMEDDDHATDEKDAEAPKCFDVTTVMPPGPKSTISCADWSGCGDGMNSRMWEFQMCTLLIVQAGFSEKSMFPVRPWELGWETEHCLNRFDVVPQPYKLVQDWGFDDLVGRGASRILFTNGLNDIWSAGSHLESLSDSILALNFPNGAHHSDLSHEGPSEQDTDDLKEGFVQISNILAGWLGEIRKE